MKKTIIIILIILLSIIIIGLTTTFIDYKRINENKKPVYAIANYNSKNKKEIYIGLFHKIERTCSISNNEQISESKELIFKVLGNKLKTNNKINTKEFLKINTKEKTKCINSELIYADKETKIYTYCLDDITITSYGKDYKLVDFIKDKKYKNISNKLTFNGLSLDKNSLELIDNNNISNNGIKIIECNINNNNDIYIGPISMTYQEDFCTNKDDDFDYFWTIKDNHEEGFKCPPNSIVEVLYEDEENIYTFECPMSDNIFVNTPAIRGREENNIPIKEALDSKLITIKEAIKRGLKVSTKKK